MGAAQALYGKFLRRETEFTDLLRSLRSYYHSLNAVDREEVVDILGSIPEQDATRELMQLHAECQWRTTRFQIIRALAKHPTARSLEFLMSLAKDSSDVPMCEAAIWSLGQTRSPQAGRFLVHLHARCTESIRPFVVGALGRIPDQTLRATLLQDLARAIESHEPLLMRNLVSTLAELRSPESLALIVPLLARQDNPTLARTALLAVGKLSRDTADLETYERSFQTDAFACDLYASVRTQVLIRSRLTAADCIEMIVSAEVPVAPLALELNLFPALEVKTLLTSALEAGHFKKVCWTLSMLNFEGTASWYADLFPYRSFTRERIFHVLESVQSHESESFLYLLEAVRARSLRDIRSPLFERWFQAASLSLPSADRVFASYMESEAWGELPTDQKVIVINHFVNFALCVQSDADHFEVICRALKKALAAEDLPQVRARLLRAFGQLERCDDDVFAFIRNRIHDIRLAASALFCVERAKPAGGLELCLEIVAEGSHKNQLAQSLLRCMAEQVGFIGPNGTFDQFLKRCLTRECPPETQLLALNLLARHPRRELIGAIVGFTRAEERLQIAAIVALKNHADDVAVDALSECLGSPSESVVGRALDSLTCAPGGRAKMIVLDFLERNIHDPEACDKVIRCLGPAGGYAGGVGVDLSGRVERLIVQNPGHPMIDGLFLLKERLNPRSALSIVASGQGVEIEQVDAHLTLALPCYVTFGEELRSVLRAAELPFMHPEMFTGAVDKSACAVQFCKAIDMRLELTWGKNRLFPALERSLHLFQNIVHGSGLAEDPPSPERSLRFFDLGSRFTAIDVPIAKMVAVARGILQGRVMGDHWKIFDGLRAWAVVLMMFGRVTSGVCGILSEHQRAILPFAGNDGAAVLDLAARLLRLQETRSLAVHRQTFSSVGELESVRAEALEILASIEALV